MSINFKILATTALAGILLTASCTGESKSDKTKKFIADFATMISDNKTDSIALMYPDVTPEDSLAKIDVESIVVEPANEQETQFKVKCGDNITLTVNMDAEGKMTIESSEGLFAYSPERMENAKKFGQWKKGASDVENSKRMNDTFFLQSIVPGIASDIKNNLRAKGTGGLTDFGPLGVKVTNGNSFSIDGEDYTVTYVQTSYMNMMGRMEGGSEHGTRPGATLAPNASKSYSVPNPGAMGGNEVSSAGIRWKLSDEQIVNKYYKATGKEYDEYLKTVKADAKDGKLDDGPYNIAGKLGGKYAIHMTLDKGMKSGSYYYDKNGSGAKLNLKVTAYNKATGQITLEETTDKGKVTGTFIGVITPKSFKGKMTAYTGKTYDFDLEVSK